jgi:hypothetical protein
LTSLLLSSVRIWSAFTFEFLGRFAVPLASARPEIDEIGFPGTEKNYYNNASGHN